MASASFRDSLSSLGWSRREADIPVNTSQQRGLLSSITSLNPFGNGGYVQLPTTEGPGAALPAPTRREEEEGWFVCESTPIVLASVARLSMLPAVLCSIFPSYPCRGDSRCRTCAAFAFPCLSHQVAEHVDGGGRGGYSRFTLLSIHVHFGDHGRYSTANEHSTVSRWDRMLIFAACNLGALACFVLAFALFPVLSLKPRKLVIL